MSHLLDRKVEKKSGGQSDVGFDRGSGSEGPIQLQSKKYSRIILGEKKLPAGSAVSLILDSGNNILKTPIDMGRKLIDRLNDEILR
jgi:hypothetical protein